MQVQAHPQLFQLGTHRVELLVPATQQPNTAATAVDEQPLWSRIWPAAEALCLFLAQHPWLIAQQQVLELGAGLGLPSFLAAQKAATVLCTDAAAAAVEWMHRNQQYTSSRNLQAQMVDWNQTSLLPAADVVLLSDVNYHPPSFEKLHQMIEYYLQQQSTIILATPQRLMAKTFLLPLLSYCRMQEEIQVITHHTNTWCSVYVLQSPEVSQKGNGFHTM